MGIHFVHYALASEKYQFKLSFFCNLTAQNRIVIRKWHPRYEDFIPVDSEQEEMYRRAVQMRDFDLNLGVYPYEKLDVWLKVSNYISQEVLSKLDPIQEQLYVIDEEYQIQEEVNENCEKKDSDLDDSFDYEAEMSESVEQQQDQDKRHKKKQKNKKDQQEDFKIVAGTIYYTEIPKKCVLHGTTAEELTKVNLDKSTLLKGLLDKEYQGSYKTFLGELQYSFVKFLLGEHYESFEQWKAMLVFSCQCEEYAGEQPEFYMELIPVLYNLLQQMPKDLFVDPLSRNNFIEFSLGSLLGICIKNKSGNKKLEQRALKLKAMVEERFIVVQDLEECGEDGPLVVEDFNFVQI